MGTRTLNRSLGILGIAAVLSAGVAPMQAALVPEYDFSTDPNLAIEWTSYGYWNTPPGGVATWNSTDEDLDLVKTGSAGNGWLLGLYQTDATRMATEPVTMTVKSMSASGGNWGMAGLMITAVPQQNYLTGTGDSYSFLISTPTVTTGRFEVRRTYADGTSNFILYQGSSFDLSDLASTPATFDIVRDGDHYQFLANDTLLYTTASPAAGDFYATAARDSMAYYQVVFGGDRAMNATVDDFGRLIFIPEPSTAILAGLGLLGLSLRRRK